MQFSSILLSSNVLALYWFCKFSNTISIPSGGLIVSKTSSESQTTVKLFRFLSGSSPKRAGDQRRPNDGDCGLDSNAPTLAEVSPRNDQNDGSQLSVSGQERQNSRQHHDISAVLPQDQDFTAPTTQAPESSHNGHLRKPRRSSSSQTDITEPTKHHHCQQQYKQQQLSTHSNNPTIIEPDILLTATDYKNAGNKLCSLFRYDEAINYYSKAISKDPDVPIFFSNRALCYLKLQQWPAAVQDCRRSLELEPNLIKAHFFLGQALAEMSNYDDALKHLQRAHELAKDKKMNFGDDITYQIRLIKRRRWNKIENETAQLEDELESYLVDLIKKDTERKLKELRERLQAIRGEGSSSQISAPNAVCAGASNEEAQLEVQESRIQLKCDSFIEKLETMFNNLKMQRKKRDVPDYLCGKISFEIMHDPVITPSGITYDRHDIEEHLRRVGHFDPITRQPLSANQLISNLAMKEVVDAYLSENEWAHYY